ncbi:MAG: peptidoglycan-associated lipoprotein Pal [Elusimicrobiaceae bacterium]|nr:peptidoglycan-associated lipoprotein Pal [Elusimicrobiaceae bacterium]
MKKIFLLVSALALVSVSGCGSKNVKTAEDSAARARAEKIGEQNLQADNIVVADDNIPILPGMEEDKIIEAAEPEANIRAGVFDASDGLAPLYFAFDKYELTDDAQRAARSNALQLKSFKKDDVLVEGHCDDRGTIEYNIALGQKRAKSVRDYYVGLGITAEKITTISYGKEKPVCSEQTDECWQKNRRAETKIRG